METLLLTLLAVYFAGCAWMFGSLARRAGFAGALALGFLVFEWPIVLFERLEGRTFGGS